MLDFAALPPEINSGLMYMGPGSGPMLAAAAAWDELAVELYATASSYGLVISDLTSGWLGPSSVSMAAAATPYVSWISSTAGQAEATGAQAKAAAAAYEAAFAMTVPPPVIAANRALLMLLIATNFFGQNTPAIMATEAQYAEMWAQDATAMYGYQAAAQAASMLSPWSAPPPTTSSTAAAGQAAAVGQAASTSAGTGAQTVAPLVSATSAQLTSVLSTPLSSAVTTTPLSSATAPNALSGVVASTASTTTSSSSSTLPLSSVSSLTSASTALTSDTSPAASLASGAGSSLAAGAGSSASMGTLGVSMLSSANSFMNSLGPAANVWSTQMQLVGSALSGGAGPGAGMFGTAGMGNAAVSTGVGRAASLGMLSVPQSWASAAPAFNEVGSALPGVSASATPAVAPGGPGGMLGAPPMLANAGRSMGTPATATPRFGFRPSFVQQPVYAG